MAGLLQPAATLDDVYKTLSPEPLNSGDKLRAFYTNDLNAVRGGDRVEIIWLNMRRHLGGAHYRAFLMGHQGVGKSTELERLIHEARFQFRPIRFSATRDLNPAGFKPFDVLLVMLIRLMQEVDKCNGSPPSDSLLHDVEQWFATRTQTTFKRSDASLETSAEAGAKAPSLLAQVLTLGAGVKSSLKYVTNRETKVEEVETASIPELIELVNKLLTECNATLKDAHGQEWIFIGEDFDKAGIPAAQTEDLFLRFGNVFHELQTHLIFTIPISLVYSDRASQLAFAGDRIHSIVDTPVFQRDHTPNVEGRGAVEAVLEKRLSSDLFADGQKMRLIVASGGNLRDLFKLVSDAADTAILRHAPDGKISKDDADGAINALRTEYLRRLGESVFDEDQATTITYEKKALRLLEVYSNARKPTVSDAVLYSLLRARAVQEFNKEGWFGVHPLVVDILQRQEQPLPTVDGKVLGGTD